MRYYASSIAADSEEEGKGVIGFRGHIGRSMVQRSLSTGPAI